VSAATQSHQTADTLRRSNVPLEAALAAAQLEKVQMDQHDHGLAHDLERLTRQMQQRRRALRWLAGAGALTLLGCGGSADGDSGATSTGSTGSSGSTGASASSCALIPEETAGPYPGDGSNSVNGSIANALMLSGILRSDIRSSIAGATGVAAGVPLTLDIRLVNTHGSCADLAGYAIYLWHCDREGRYSMYSSGITDQNYLRGVQQTDSNGVARFITIFPGCYSGRMPHMHFEIFRTPTTATTFSNKLRTSQIAFANEISGAVYAGAAGYATSAANFARVSFATDGIFSDGYALQLAELSGTVAAGYSGQLTVGIGV
jgi:protocatechuate 3,4-dioxygenase beta subunit